MEKVRLFDFLTEHIQKRPKQQFLAAKYSGQWKHFTFEEVYNIVQQVSQLLLDLGLKKEDKIALIAKNCPEWNFVDLGAQQIGVVVVPMYPTISEKDYEFIFNDAGIQYAFVGDNTIYQKVKPLLGRISTFKDIYTFEKIEGVKQLMASLPQNPNASHIQSIAQTIDNHDLATIIYTSGTTGFPKGVMLTHENMGSNVISVLSCLPFESGKRTLSFLPLCHSFERIVFYVYLKLGMHIHYAESLDTIGENLKEVKPFCFTTVPRLLEKVYEKIMAKGLELTGIKKKLFFWSLNLGSKYKIGEDLGFWYNFQLSIARKLVFSKWQEALGGELKFIVTGAAAMQPRLITLFTAAGVNVIEGYGLTETAPVLSVNRIGEKERCIGTVGIPIPGVEIKLAEDGEILAKGKNVMKGYYNRPDLTADVIDKDGWFHTGDIGTWVEKFGKKFLKITDRKKELFKTAGGKYVAPQVIENKLKESNFIEQIMVVGEDKKFVSAIIVPSFTVLEKWAAENNIPTTSRAELIKHPKVLEKYDKEIQRFNPDFGQWEQIKKFELVPDEWSVDSGDLTPTMKLKRKILLQKYAALIEKIYQA